MNLDRPNLLKREGSGLTTYPSEILSLELSASDIDRLADPRIRFATARFMEFEEPVAGWAPEDKVHVWLKDPVAAEDNDIAAELRLDPGGDLYFTVWNNDSLRAAGEFIEYADMEKFIKDDPSNIIPALGIQIIRLYRLSDLASRL